MLEWQYRGLAKTLRELHEDELADEAAQRAEDVRVQLQADRRPVRG